MLAAVRVGWDRLDRGESALEAAVSAACALEDDPAFNAGTGSTLRLDGKTVQMDAAVMDHRSAFGAVAAIERVRNPVRVARAVLDTPHLLLAGSGALRLARRLGMPDYDPSTPEGRARHERRLERIRRGEAEFDWRGSWNFQSSPEDVFECDTIGVVARDGRGGYACAASSGGFGFMLDGRVGDVPILGAGCYAGPDGAVCATGDGEAIMHGHVSQRVYELLAAGHPVHSALERGLAMVPADRSLGLLALGPDTGAATARSSMAWSGIIDGREI